ncbi:hypothetical protein COSO111634_18125 [Corallococcus soli]
MRSRTSAGYSSEKWTKTPAGTFQVRASSKVTWRTTSHAPTAVSPRKDTSTGRRAASGGSDAPWHSAKRPSGATSLTDTGWSTSPGVRPRRTRRSDGASVRGAEASSGGTGLSSAAGTPASPDTRSTSAMGTVGGCEDAGWINGIGAASTEGARCMKGMAAAPRVDVACGAATGATSSGEAGSTSRMGAPPCATDAASAAPGEPARDAAAPTAPSGSEGPSSATADAQNAATSARMATSPARASESRPSDARSAASSMLEAAPPHSGTSSTMSMSSSASRSVTTSDETSSRASADASRTPTSMPSACASATRKARALSKRSSGRAASARSSTVDSAGGTLALSACGGNSTTSAERPSPNGSRPVTSR